MKTVTVGHTEYTYIMETAQCVKLKDMTMMARLPFILNAW